ncbi:hypothetical protein [Desulfobacula phenolica]|uniref:Uncharacterized protein n=1 Tax=Desulfobacula phenolica TaxID=90732 RepID=A0A1H2E4J9_9BACT|nr:hypothetical protein [Desulfobacula phenolica]SDT89919.1 hypothetical protein SAMN04487931_102487 [Desulfobacula phenolica]
MVNKIPHPPGPMFKLLTILVAAYFILLPTNLYATQLHINSEGIITHQAGHLFFLFSMVTLIFTIKRKGLDKQKGWRLIQYSAFFFIVWNLDVIIAHFLDNQAYAVKIENLSLTRIKVVAQNNSALLAWLYYGLKLDHLLCVPAMILFYKGLSSLVSEHQQQMAKKERS